MVGIVLRYSAPVEEYLQPTTRCYNCQRFGHVTKSSNGQMRCKICAGAHDYRACTSRNQPKCANCNGDHTASYAGCPKHQEASLLKRQEILHGRIPKQGSPPLNLDVVNPVKAAPPLQSAERKKTYAMIPDGLREMKSKPSRKYSQGKTSPSVADLHHETQQAFIPL